jgi:uncharacterized protein
MINRALYHLMNDKIANQKVSILYGARRVGKTELINRLFDKYKKHTLMLNGEDEDVQKLLSSKTINNYKKIIQNNKLLIIDEAHHIPDIHLKVKLMIDEIKPLHIILTGSSAFNLSQKGEPLVGRMYQYVMYPLAQSEIGVAESALETKQNIEDRLVYGSYPEVLSLKTPIEKSEYLKEIVNTYLLKDILAFEEVRNSKKILELLKKIAYRVGSEISHTEIGKELQISKNTVARYLDLLEKVFVIEPLSAFAKNLDKEIVKTKKWFFLDNGLRNAVISDFKPAALRSDIGALWENYIISEKIKKRAYKRENSNLYFWRTYDQQEIDLVEEKNKYLTAYEIKYKSNNAKMPIAFRNAYDKAIFKIINNDNYLDEIV